MNTYDRLYALAKEIDENVNRISTTADNVREQQTRLPIPGNFGTVTVKGNGKLVSVDLDPRRLKTTDASVLGQRITQAIRQGKETRAGGPLLPLCNIQKAPYPEQADQQIRKYASEVPSAISNVGKQAIQVLDQIKNELFGNADKVEGIANQWAQSRIMGDSALEVQDATNNLAGYWEGPAFQQYAQYSGNVIATMNSNQSAMTSISNTLAQCAKTVHDTYASAILFIGNCAADLAGLGLYSALSAIPGVDIVSIPALIIKVIDTLSSFVKNVTDLVSSAISQIGSYQSSGTSFLASGNSFRAPSAPGEELGHTSSWLVTDRKPQ